MEMDWRNKQTEVEDHTLVDIEEQATQHVVTAMKGKLQRVSGRQKDMDGRNEQTKAEEIRWSLVESLAGAAPAWTPTNGAWTPQPVPVDTAPAWGHTYGAACAWTPQPVLLDASPARTLEVPKHREKDQHATQKLVEDTKEKLESLSDASEERCIYRVPKHLRDTNEAAYVPRLVSLGPFHHGNENLKAMEEHKWRCFNSFTEKHKIDWDALLMLIKGQEKKTRGFYADHFKLTSDQFVQVILVDAIFVINFLLESKSSALAVDVRSFYHKKFFFSVVSRDMMLLENQLPLFILEEILNFVKRTRHKSITELPSVFGLSECLFNILKKTEEEVSASKLCNCLFNCYMKEGTDPKSAMTDLNRYNNARHFVDFQRLLYMPQEARRKPKKNGKFKEIKSISKLHEAGVRFKVASGKKLFHVEFKDGLLEIPGILVSDPTEAIFRNLSAYDQCHYGPSPIGDYFVLMGMLIDTADDVDLLVKNKILQNDLATAQEVSKVFNSLEKEVFYEAESFYYSHLCEQLNDFCDIPWHKWMATLKQNYLDTPWKVISLIAAFILLVLTLIQTVCSVI